MSENAEPRFLIVDDFSTMRRVMRALLKDIGFEHAEAAADGGVALQMLKQSRFDFIITDIMMPNMNGFELLTAIKADAALKHLPVLMVTAEARKDDIVRSMQSGAAGYIVKPFTKATLEERLRKLAPALFVAVDAAKRESAEAAKGESAEVADGEPVAAAKGESAEAGVP
jgi:two-component system chemotaxis response regulator CheY